MIVKLEETMEKNGSVTTEDYGILMTVIVQKMVTVMGKEKALKLAARVPGVVLAPDGRVTSSSSLESLRLLAREYRSAAGTVSLYLMKGAIASVADGKKLPLPDELR